jgi:hypothetical protein
MSVVSPYAAAWRERFVLRRILRKHEVRSRNIRHTSMRLLRRQKKAKA